jgi:chemotaxis signal transduction protein
MTDDGVVTTDSTEPNDAARAQAADALLRRRAAALARRPDRRDTEETWIELLTFSLAHETFGLPVASAREVFRPLDLALLPGAEPPAYAVTPWRGILLTVLDLRATLGTGATGITDLSHVLAVGLDRRSIGVLIDRVRAIETVAESSLLAPSRGADAERPLVRAITRDAVHVLDAEALLETYG